MNKFVVIVVAIVALVGGMMSFNYFTKVPLPEHALYYQQPRVIEPFSFTDHQGNAFTNSQLKDKWSLVFFGYTSCPDVCPTTMQELNFVYQDLKTEAPNTQVLLVSVDPNRDSQGILAEYIDYFHEEFIALRGGHEQLFPFSRNVGLMYAMTDDTAGENYLVDHSASIVLINPNGQVSAIFKPEQALGKVPAVAGDKVVKDFARIVKLFG